MKLNINFNMLNQAIKKMNAQEKEFSLDIKPKAFDHLGYDVIEGELNKDFYLDDIEIGPNEILHVQGNPVMLYIPDHSYNYLATMEDPHHGKKVHFAECKTISSMRNKGFIERYTVTNNTSGLFKIYQSKHYQMTDHADGEVRLSPCQNCLRATKYDHFSYKTYSEKQHFIRNFDYFKLFEKHRAIFSSLPREKTKEDYTYSQNWKETSFRVKKQAHFMCSHCGVNLSQAKDLMHTHHIDRMKGNNQLSNLTALCIECHAAQPYHQHMKVTEEQQQRLLSLRWAQGIDRYKY